MMGMWKTKGQICNKRIGCNRKGWYQRKRKIKSTKTNNRKRNKKWKNYEQKSVQTDEHSQDGIKGNPGGIRDKPDADSTAEKDGAVIGDNNVTNEKEKSNKPEATTKQWKQKKTKKEIVQRM